MATATLKAQQTIQEWGNGLAVRLTAPIARAARLPMTTAVSHEGNPFAIKFAGPRRRASYVLAHHPKSLDWRRRGARPHPWKQVPPLVFAESCDALNQIIAIGA